MAVTSSRCAALVLVVVWLQSLTPAPVGAQFQNEPRDAEILLYGLAIMECAAVVPPDAEVYWSIAAEPRVLTIGANREFDGVDVPSRFSLQGEDGSDVFNLVISGVVAADAGVYRCNVIMPGRGDTSPEVRSTRPATLSVVQVPANGVPTCWVEEGRQAQVGDDLSLRCASADADIELTWYAEDVALGSTRFQISTTPFGVAIDSHLLAQASADQQTFTCQPNTDQYSTCSVTVEVLHAPVVTIEASGVLETGADASFTCKATGNPPFFAYTWHYNDYTISFEENPRFNRARLEKSGSVLVLPELAATDDNATLRCEAVNSLGETTESHVIRTVPGKTLAQIIGPILLGIILGLVLIVLCFYGWWWRRQRRKVKQISRKKKSIRRAFSLRGGGHEDDLETVESGTVYKQAIGGFGSSRYGKTPSVNGDVPRSGLDLQSAGYGPDLTDTSGYRATAEVEPEDDGALRPIPRKKSTSSLSSVPNGGARASTTSDDRPLVEPEPDKSFTYYVNPHFDETRQAMVMTEHKENELNPPEYNIMDDNAEKKISNEDENEDNILSTEL